MRRRSIFTPSTRYIGVLLQRGRVQLDADSDEHDYSRFRRLLLYVETSIGRALQWAGFEPSGSRRKRRRRSRL